MMTQQEQADIQAELERPQSRLLVALPTDDLTALQEAADELTRELGVRGRLKDRWIAEKRWTVTEARERIVRHKLALEVVLAVLAAMEARPGV